LFYQTIVVEETEKERDDVLRQKRTGQKRYAFDIVFDEDSTQVKNRRNLLFNEVELIIKTVPLGPQGLHNIL